MIKVGDALPNAPITLANTGNHQAVNAAEWAANKKVVIFALPGAFTPTCSAAHLPGFVVKADEIKAKGVDEIACLSVNDSFVMEAWGTAQNAEAITMIADCKKSLGLRKDIKFRFFTDFYGFYWNNKDLQGIKT